MFGRFFDNVLGRKADGRLAEVVLQPGLDSARALRRPWASPVSSWTASGWLLAAPGSFGRPWMQVQGSSWPAPGQLRERWGGLGQLLEGSGKASGQRRGAGAALGGSLSGPWAVPGRPLGGPWAVPGRPCAALGRSLGVPGRPWAVVGRPWAVPGRSLGVPGRSWASLGGLF